MRKIFYCLATALILWCGNASAEETLSHDKIYFFSYDGCPYCHQAEDFINKNYPRLKIEKMDIHKPGGMYLLRKCAEKFKLGRNVGTPLFCMGDDYIMGWSEEMQERFIELSKPFNP